MHRLSVSARLGLAAIAIAIAAAVFCGPAAAQTYTVTNLAESGSGSLRAEVVAANGHSGADTVVFASGLSGTIEFTSAGIVIEGSIDIEGPGPGIVTVHQTAAHRVFEVEGIEGKPVTIAGLHLDGGTAPSSGAHAGFGGDIYSEAASLTLANDLITGGEASDEAGGVESYEGSLTLRSTTVSGNHALGEAGIFVGGGPFAWTIVDSTISGNVASGAEGGLVAQSEGAPGLLEGSTISGNTANSAAGAQLFESDGGQITVRDSTIAGNTAANGVGGLEIELLTGAKAVIEDSTIAGNSAGKGSGGGIGNIDEAGLSIVDSIVASNSAKAGGPDIFSLNAPIPGAFDLIGNSSGSRLTESVAGSDLLGADPALGPLADNGGPTQTMALNASSPAVNKGSGTLTADQRGLARPIAYPGVADSSAPGANGADIGAFELQLPVAPTQPSNRFRLGKVTLNRHHGTALIAIAVPGPGTLRLLASRRLKAASKTVKGTGTVKLLVKAKGGALRALHHGGSAKVRATIVFAPSGGAPASQARTLRLVEKPPPRRG